MLILATDRRGDVASGFFRNHLYVTLGLATLATLVGLSSDLLWWAPAAAAVASYCGAVCWLVERRRAGSFCLIGVALLTMTGMLNPSSPDWFAAAGIFTSAMVLGLTTTAMLLGHWYLNAPGMRIETLQRLLVLAALALIGHAVVCGYGAAQAGGHLPWTMLVLRWAFGFGGVLILLLMAWQTL